MKNRAFWLPVIVSLVATPVFLFIGVASAGVGHSDSRPATCTLFPYAMLLGREGMTFFALMVAQFPLYGLVLGAAARRGWFVLALVLILAAHAAAAAACFATLD